MNDEQLAIRIQSRRAMVESSQKGLFQVKIKYAHIFGHLDI